MRRLTGPPLLAIGLAGGCTCSAKPGPPSAGVVASSLPGMPSAARLSPSSEAVFSAPIAAAQGRGLRVVVGLVASEGVVRARGFPATGPAWTADVIGKATWSPDADLRLSPVGDGFALVSRGLGGNGDRTLVLLGSNGELRVTPGVIGAAFCATADGLTWVDPRPGGPLRVQARSWSQSVAREVATIAEDRRPSLVCGEHQAFVLGDGDDDVTLTSFTPGEAAAKPPIVALRDSDFRDDEREHDTYSIGDDLGILRISEAGSMTLREILAEGGPTPWRKLKHALSEDDDVVAVDGNASVTLVVFTQEAPDACRGRGATAEWVRALRVNRATGDESMLDLARPDCERSPGPFWVGAAAGEPVVAWIDRATKVASTDAAIRGLATRLLLPGATKPGNVGIQADALVDGGCDQSGCFAAALVRPAGSDGMQPAAIAILDYP